MEAAMNKYEEILSQMTLEEKASLCSGLTFWLTKPVERLNIPSVLMTDGPHGLRKEVESERTNIMKHSEPATCFPPAVTLASSWDRDLVEQVGAAIADEAKEQGQSTVLGPGINIKRSPLCGRNFEYFSEDPFVAGEMGGAWVRGVQRNGIGVSLKHFCANNQERLRMTIDSIVDERALREIYLAAFESIVKKEQPTTVMCSYNRLNGTYLSDNKRLLTDILRDEWGFKGIVVSDWGAVNDRVEGIKAGLDLEMPGNGGQNDKNIIKAVKEGRLDEKDLDKVVLRMIKFAFECKEKEVPGHKADYESHHALSRKAAESGAVLLKNEGKLLPLKEDEKITVIGKLAEVMRYQGAGSSRINPTKLTPFLKALEQEGKDFEFAEGYTLKGDGYNTGLIKKAVKLAQGKDKVVVFIGLTDSYESEGFDRTHLNLPDGQILLLNELKKVNENIIVVLHGGSPVRVSTWADCAKSILNVYLPGQAGGEATLNLLLGRVNPSGKLAETYPPRLESNVSSKYFPMGPRTVEYRESIYVGYRYFDKAEKDVAFPFGYGLSYTTFEYSDLKLSSDKIKEGETLKVSLKVKNTGDMAGAEVVQIYVSDVESTIFKPVKELKGFTKVFLNPGEEKEVTIELDSRAFSYYNVLIKDWHVESGEFEILAAASSRDIRLKAKVYVESLNPDAPIPDYKESAPYYYDIKDNEGEGTRDIPVEQFEAIYGSKMIPNTPPKKGEFDMNTTVYQTTVTSFGRFMYRLLAFGSKILAGNAENSQMVQESLKDLPLRSFAGFTGGILSQKSVEGIQDILNGKRGGVRKFFKGFKKKA